jgi:hypothetical protein
MFAVAKLGSESAREGVTVKLPRSSINAAREAVTTLLAILELSRVFIKVSLKRFVDKWEKIRFYEHIGILLVNIIAIAYFSKIIILTNLRKSAHIRCP